MSDQDLFNAPSGGEVPVTPVTPAPVQDTLATLLASITDENGRQKYASIDKALEGLKHSQMFIPQLKTELDQERLKRIEIEARLKSQSDLEAALDQLVAKRSDPGAELPTGLANGIDEQKVQDIVRTYFEGKEAATKADQNRAIVIQELTKKFGDKAKEAIVAKAAELDMTPDQLGNMATQNPKAVLAFFSTGVSTPQSSTPPPSLNIPSYPKDEKLPERMSGMLSGVPDREKAALMRRIREEVHKEFGVTQ